jgi:pimeloyl-ACP methyl ester carboxylesterase/ubiquinone/menaquinone biosynthesis C-methylase UbiE
MLMNAAIDPRERLLAGMPVTEKRLALAGVSTAVLEGGKGTPLVLLHGPGEFAAKWLRVIPALVGAYRVIAPDLPGHGASTIEEGAPDAARVLAWLDALIARTCAEPPVLVGQIVGGAIAARYAARPGARVRALVLADALGLAPFQPAPEFGQALMGFLAQPTGENHDRFWQRCASDLDALRRSMGERWAELRAYNLDRARAPHVQAAVQGLMQHFGLPAIPEEDLGRIAVPTALIWGRHDLATPLAVAESASRRYGWPLHVIDGAADDPALEQPQAFLQALRAALGETARDAWDRVAAGYDRTNTPTQMWLANEGLSRAGLCEGMALLDVAAGSGALSIPAARLGAQVLAVDQSPAMLDLLRSRARREKLGIETRVMDGQALALEDGQFDIAASQFGVMLFPDMPRGMRELARVVKRGGRVLVHAYGDPHRIDFLTFLIGALQSVRPEFTGPPMEPPPLPFQLADPARLRDALAAAGLKEVRVETVTETTPFRGGEELWDWIAWSNPIVGEVIGALALTHEELGTVRRALDSMVRERAESDAVARLRNPVHIGIGTK